MTTCDSIFWPVGWSVRRSKPVGRKFDKYPGITTDATTLGVHRIHLYLVLDGRRESRSLMARYQALKAGRDGK